MAEIAEQSQQRTIDAERPSKKRRWRWVWPALLVVIFVALVARAFLPTAVRWYVNDVIDRSPLYDGLVGDIDVHLWRGAYSIKEIRVVKTTGNVPVPLFAAKRMDLAIQWDALTRGKVVGKIVMFEPELNFVDSEDESEDQTGAGGPWLEMLDDLFPFRINSAIVQNGSIHFRAFGKDPPVDVYMSQLEASVENLTNIDDEINPLIATVNATALAMDSAKLEYQMKLDPFSHRPTFQLAVRLVELDVTKTNALARAYGAFDFEHGWFDLIIELDAEEGRVEGYVKPLFRNLKVLSLKHDLHEDNVLAVFWEALVGTAAEVLKNQPRDQVATVIPLRGDLSDPRSDLFSIIGNILHNAFIRVYLPKLEGVAGSVDDLQFGTGTVSDPITVGDD